MMTVKCGQFVRRIFCVAKSQTKELQIELIKFKILI